MNATEMDITRQMFAKQAERHADLLAALLLIAQHVMYPNSITSREVLDIARAAIAKAEGEA